MNTEEREAINRRVHEAMGKELVRMAHLTVMGQCVDDGSSAKAYTTPPNPACPKCGYAVVITDADIPDYTSSLDAVAEFEKYVIEKVGIWKYATALNRDLLEKYAETPVQA